MNTCKVDLFIQANIFPQLGREICSLGRENPADLAYSRLLHKAKSHETAVACRDKLMGFICEYQAEHRPLLRVHGSQSAYGWASSHGGPKNLGEVAVVKFKWLVLYLGGHGSTTSNTFRVSLCLCLHVC